MMNDDEIWAAIDEHRLRTADLLDSLSNDEWRHPSLCDGWTVHDVAAHLTLQQIRLRDILPGAIRHPGGINRMIRESAKRRAGLSRQEIVGEIRRTVGSRRHNIGVTCRETLIDILVHSQDIALPL
ncbi:MAG TPA: maleylpyruvate isomerase family mycothiol-dependent enzyme, partial [Mycobacterium sp.]|nr:maleylpyruvate isomerase family mycothiol-dependent enzyme [Mycobacterium sp.]